MTDADASQPFLLIVDGHPSRLCYQAIRVLQTFNIQLVVLPEHTSHILQPLDVAIFSPMKAHSKKIFERTTIRYDARGNVIIKVSQK